MNFLGIQTERTSSLSRFEEFSRANNKSSQQGFSSILSDLNEYEIEFLNQYSDSENSYSEDCVSESEEETLPSYDCSVLRKGTVLVKQEINESGMISTDCKWRQVYLSVEGTKVTMDYGSGSRRRPSLLASWGLNFSVNESTNNPKELPNYTRTLPIEGAVLSVADDYVYSKPYTFRMSLANGEHLLIRSDSRWSAEKWVDSLRSAINISSDLDSRQEPNFSLRRIIFSPY